MAAGGKVRCKYWEKCFRKDENHKNEFLHPRDEEAEEDMDISEDAPKKEPRLYGKWVCFTGKFQGGTRREMQEEAEEYGCVIKSGPSRMVHILIYGEDAGQALDKARDYYLIKTMSEKEWRALLSKTTKMKRDVNGPRAINHDISDDEDNGAGRGSKSPAKRPADDDDTDVEDDDSGASPPKKIKTDTDSNEENDKRPKCKYWEKCYRRDANHRKAFQHPSQTLATKTALRKTRSMTKSDDGDTELMDVDVKSVAQPKTSLADGESVSVKGQAYTMKRVGNSYYCTCPGWKNQNKAVNKRTCKHLKALLGEEFENTRAGEETIWPSGRSKRTPPPTRKPTHTNIQVMLAHKWTESVDPKGWWMSEKLDGVRAYWNGRKFFSRLGNEFIPPQWFIKNFPSDMTLDGELFGGRGKFQTTVSIVKTAECDDWKKLKYHIFDAPSLGKQPFEDRMKTYNKYFDENNVPYATVVEQNKCKGKDNLQEELKRIEDLGGEGVMIRKPGSKYEHSRSHASLKIKTFHDAEAKVIGFEPGKGRNASVVGALRCEMECGKIFKVGSGLSDKDRRKPPKKGSIITYRFQELTVSGVPRFPSYVGIRIDMDGPKDAVLPPKPVD